MICTGCPVRDACLSATLTYEADDPDGHRWGVAGGLTAHERDILVNGLPDPPATRQGQPAHILAKARAARAAKGPKTHCVHGHEYTPENTHVSGGRRFCRTCNRAQQLRRREARRALDTPAPQV